VSSWNTTCWDFEHHLPAVCNATPDPSVVTSDNAAPQETIPLPELYGVNGTLGADELIIVSLIEGTLI
jgi:hypothetical protein